MSYIIVLDFVFSISISFLLIYFIIELQYGTVNTSQITKSTKLQNNAGDDNNNNNKKYILIFLICLYIYIYIYIYI